MGGGLMQLVAYGAQDIYLTGNPQITFFKVVYRRHTNFAMEAIEQVFNGVANFGNKVVCTIARNGDLVGRMYLEIDLADGTKNANAQRIGHKLIKSAEVEIGGQRIDKHYGEWLDIWAQLSTSAEERHKLYQMVDSTLPTLPASANSTKLYIPLQFWFNRNPGLALPLIALQYHEVKVTIDFEQIKNITQPNINSNNTRSAFNNASVSFSNCCLYCDYIFLDTDERRRFAQVSHEYLIEQLQTTGTCSFSQKTSKVNINLNFNHPCKELLWVVQNQAQKGTYNFTQNNGNKGGDRPDIETTPTVEFVKTAKLQLNGHDRFRERQGSYFRCVQPNQHHTGGQSQGRTLKNASDVSTRATANDEFGYIYTYSFALKPEEHQPSGTCNFSRIDNAVLNMTLQPSTNGKQYNGSTSSATGLLASDVTDKDVRVYATNYNVLRIMSGMGGLAYSN